MWRHFDVQKLYFSLLSQIKCFTTTFKSNIGNVTPQRLDVNNFYSSNSEFAPVIADIYNASLREGYLPPILKCATVTPIPKKKPPNNSENDIRPISLTCQIAIIM